MWWVNSRLFGKYLKDTEEVAGLEVGVEGDGGPWAVGLDRWELGLGLAPQG